MDRYSHTQVDTDLSTGNLRDHFLIAMPGMHGSSFAQTLIYLCDHNENGAMGFTLNYPMSLTLGDIFAQLGLPDSANLGGQTVRSEEHTSELQSRGHLVCRLLLEKT